MDKFILKGGGGASIDAEVMEYKGGWAANTNTPTLSNSDTSVHGNIYIVTADGSTDFGAGSISFEAGDFVVNNGTIWEKVDSTKTAAQIKTAYESNADTNAYTDSEKTKLSNVEDGAEVNDVNSVNSQTGTVVLDADSISDAATINKFATASQLSKLDGVEAGATADQTDAEIKIAIDNELTGSTVGTSDTQTLTNKTIDADNNTISNIDNNEIKASAGISFSKLETVATDHIVGRTAAGSGVVTGLTATQVRAILNVENGATADQSDAEIETAYNNQVDIVTQVEAEAGTDTNVHRWTPERVKQAIDANAGGGGGTIKSIQDKPLASTTVTSFASRAQIGTKTLNLATGKKYIVILNALHNTNNTSEGGANSIMYIEFSGYSGSDPQYYSFYSNFGDSSSILVSGTENSLYVVAVSQTPTGVAVKSTDGGVITNFILDTTSSSGTLTLTPTHYVNGGSGTQASYVRQYTLTAIEITG